MWIVAKRGADRGAVQDEALGVSHATDTDMASIKFRIAAAA
jgi:hypothetical protein